MKPVKKYENVIRRFYRPEIHNCPECGKSLKRAITVTERTVVTLRAYPNNPVARKAIKPQEKWRKAR